MNIISFKEVKQMFPYLDNMGVKCVVYEYNRRHNMTSKRKDVKFQEKIAATIPKDLSEEMDKIIKKVHMATQQPEMVNHPAHYGGETNPYEVIKVIEAWGLNKSFCLGNAIKYIARQPKVEKLCGGVITVTDTKLRIEDLKKAAWYLNREIENMEKKNENH